MINIMFCAKWYNILICCALAIFSVCKDVLKSSVIAQLRSHRDKKNLPSDQRLIKPKTLMRQQDGKLYLESIQNYSKAGEF